MVDNNTEHSMGANIEALQAMADRLRPGDQVRKPSETARKLGRSVSWLWERLRKDASFPRPLYNGEGSCFFIEREIDEYLKRTLCAKPSDRARYAREQKLAA